MNYTLWDPNLGNVNFSRAVLSVLGTGNSWYVNETTGNDSNAGTSQSPFKTLTAALAAAVPSNGDVVYVQGSIHLSTGLVWNKNDVSIVGINAPSNNDRARISVLGGISQTQVTALTALMTVTAQGCAFIDIGAFYGFDGTLTPPSSAVCWSDTGGRNFYQNCGIFGFGDALTAAIAGARALTVGGNGENLFVGCTFGVDTEVRATNANSTIEFLAASGSARNVFRSCIFECDSTDASNTHILISSGGIDRYALFDRCTFHNFNATALSAVAVNSGGSPGGNVVLQDCTSVGATAMATTGNIFITGNVPVATTSSIAILAT